jgi:hypothetical protein
MQFILNLDLLLKRDSLSLTPGTNSSQTAGPELYCCLAHLKYSLQARADELVEEVFFIGLLEHLCIIRFELTCCYFFFFVSQGF